MSPLVPIRTLLIWCSVAWTLQATEPCSAQQTSVQQSSAEQWGVYEATFSGPAVDLPYREVQLSARFTQGSHTVSVPGFWDGDTTYRIRFSPPTPGEWRYETTSNRAELNGHAGVLTAEKPSANNHGPVQVFKTFYLQYADGTPYHQFGTTCYAWVHQTKELQEQTLQTLAASPFNKIRFCVFPKAYVYNQNEPERFPFEKEADGTFNFARPDPAFWRHFEQQILALQRLGIEADLILWHPYDRWGFADMSDEQDDCYLRYCIARLAAFRNVWWSLANEYDFMTDRPPGHRGNKQFNDWDRFFSILQKEDPFERLRGIHNGSVWYDHTRDWVTHASLQTSDMHQGVRFREKYGKPVLYDECRYEGNIPQGWGNLSGREMNQRFWLGTLSGCYVGHGETYKHADDILWWSKGGVLHGESPPRIKWLKEFMATAPPFEELQPLGDEKGRFLLAKPGEYYLLYAVGQQPQSVTLAGDRPYKLDAIDPWNMTVVPMGTAPAGDFAVSPLKPDTVYRLTPYAAGETLRPQARMTASVTEGQPPLTVQFTSDGDYQAHWDFGDGETSDQRNPTHVFRKPGLYCVTLTVTDADGGSGVSFLQIALDRDVEKPLVRAGFEQGDLPPLTLQGTARRDAAGTLQLPDGAPWGSAQVGEGVLEDLRGLRSFTVMGWLKPESLQTGSGGNRIVFCLNQDHSGIDLVCHTDGRLRLAVNQWPDAVDNDSSPGKLQVGRWTFFAVSYDATQTRDNVRWYFSEPRDAPGATAIELDRKTSYNVGPMAVDIGPLTIGNFNETMLSYGLDRQFRGEMRALQIFGSRVSERGARSLDQIREALR
ncbi:MAG: DUF5060 domain-containing protein [Pirellulaceae bacterium]